MNALSREEVRSLDRIAVERFGIPDLILMENAGRGATDALFRLLPGLPEPAGFTVVAGPGNNGGDGFVIARHLALRGREVQVLILGESARFRGPGAAGLNFAILERMGVTVESVTEASVLSDRLAQASVVVDAILGTGISGEVRGVARIAIQALHACPGRILAVDTPSGLDCDTGRPLGIAVRAEATATFAAMKRGFLEPGASAYTGRVEVVGIGCPLVWE